MKVAVLQHDIAWEDRQSSFGRLTPMIAQAAAAGAKLAVLTEMFAVGFSLDVEAIAEPVGGPSTEFLVAEAGRHGIWICGSIPERPSPGAVPVNQLLVVGPDGTISRYAKIHPFSYAHEDRCYRPGEHLLTVPIEGTSVTFFVCYDLRFANVFWQSAERTDAYVVVANWPASRRAHWKALLVARAIENQAYVVAANRVGSAQGQAYSGDSAIIDPWGEILATASNQEAVLVAEVDPATVAKTRADYPFMADRRIIPD
jgi:predicted amidohydrolase